MRVHSNCTVGQNFGVTSHSYLLGVPRWRVADLPGFQISKRQSFPIVVDIGLMGIVRSALSPFPNLEMQHNKKEC